MLSLLEEEDESEREEEEELSSLAEEEPVKEEELLPVEAQDANKMVNISPESNNFFFIPKIPTYYCTSKKKDKIREKKITLFAITLFVFSYAKRR